jgi:hypothetical protein
MNITIKYNILLMIFSFTGSDTFLNVSANCAEFELFKKIVNDKRSSSNLEAVCGIAP